MSTNFRRSSPRLLQADQLGVPVKSVLQTQAERLRVERKQMFRRRRQKRREDHAADGGVHLSRDLYRFARPGRNEPDIDVLLKGSGMKTVTILRNAEPNAKVRNANRYFSRLRGLLGRTLEEGAGFC
jgi:hypothetical protein